MANERAFSSIYLDELREEQVKMEQEGNGWPQYQKLVLAELERLSAKVEKIETDLTSIKLKMAGIAGVIGFCASLIPIIFQWFVNQAVGTK